MYLKGFPFFHRFAIMALVETQDRLFLALSAERAPKAEVSR